MKQKKKEAASEYGKKKIVTTHPSLYFSFMFNIYLINN